MERAREGISSTACQTCTYVLEAGNAVYSSTAHSKGDTCTCGPGVSARDQDEVPHLGTGREHRFGLLLLVDGGLATVAMCPLDNLCSVTAGLPMGKGHKKMLNAVKWQNWDFNQGLTALPKLGFHTAWW